MSKELSIVVSALNEEKNVRNLFQRLTSALDKNRIDGEIVFLNNHSTDRTGPFADAFAKKSSGLCISTSRGLDPSAGPTTPVPSS